MKISKHLKYLKTHGMVDAKRDANWMIYSLPSKLSHELKTNLACLQDCAKEDPEFRRDLQKLTKLRSKFEADSPIRAAKLVCC